MAIGTQPPEKTYQGIGVSPGIARGKIVVYRIPDEVMPQYDVAPEQLAQEIARFEQALITTRKQLHDLQERITTGTGSTASSGILDVHISITEDPALVEPVITRLETEKKNVEFIFHKVAQKYVQTLSELPDDYLRERAADVQDVTRRILRNLLGREHRGLATLPPDTIVVASDLSPSDTTSIDRKNVGGFATDVGSHTSHTAIVARSMSLPAVVGLRDASLHVHDGQEAILDGYSGTLIINPSKQTLYIYGQLESKRHTITERLAALKDLPAETLDGHRVALSGNIELPHDVPGVMQAGGEGVGLFRTEFLYLSRKDYPTEQEQYEQYLEVARAVKPHYVIIRTLDLGGDKFRKEDQPSEVNPFLGFRAIRFCLANPEVFTAQLRAILRASAEGNVLIMYPMISGVAEVIEANSILENVKNDLRREGIPFDENIRVGAMIEIPSAALTAEMIAQEVDFFSIGSNDLIQYTMAVDRVNEKVANLYDPTHPAILRLIRSVVEAAHNNSIWVGVCGEMAGEPLYAPLLVGMGVDELSVSASALPRVKEVIRRMKITEAQELAAATLHVNRSGEVNLMLKALLQRIDPDLLS